MTTRIRIYAADDSQKSGRKQINKTTTGPATIVAALTAVLASLSSQSADNQAKVTRVLIDIPSAKSAADSIALDFGGEQEQTEQSAPEQPATEQPAPEQPAPEQPAPEQPKRGRK